MNKEQLQRNMATIWSLIQVMGLEKHIALYRFLQERINYPESFVVMLGETGSGKSTLINGLLGQAILPTSASPTTGTVVEVMDSWKQFQSPFYAVNRDATLEIIDNETFAYLAQFPDEELQRLRLLVEKFPHNLQYLRLFDTPGYGSINEKHDEILKDFLPNSDIVIYVVMYRVGFQEDDHFFMQYIGELVDEFTTVLLVINRVPDKISSFDKRIMEIKKYAEDCLHRELPTFLVPTEAQNEVRLPAANELWELVSALLQSPDREQLLLNAMAHYQIDLLSDYALYLDSKILKATASQEEQRVLSEEIQPFLSQEDKIKDYIEKSFSQISEILARMMNNASNSVKQKCQADIYSMGKWTEKDQCLSYIQNHSMQFAARQEAKQISDYLEDELNRVDEEVYSMLNTAVVDFERRVALRTNIYHPLVLKMSKYAMTRATTQGLTNYFARFGGAGGAGAGVANAAKKGLKNLGKLFGKTFSRDTHNALAQFLKKIGATSAKSLAVAAVVIVEGAFYLYDSLTWQKDLAKKVDEAVDIWERNSLGTLLQDMKELKEHNLEKLSEYFNDYRDAFKPEDTIDNSFDIEEAKSILDKANNLINTIDQQLEGL